MAPIWWTDHAVEYLFDCLQGVALVPPQSAALLGLCDGMPYVPLDPGKRRGAVMNVCCLKGVEQPP